MEKFGLKPFQEFDCGEVPVETIEKTNFRLNYIFYNNSDKEVFFNFLDTEGKVLNSKKLSILPKSFKLNQFSIAEDILVQVLENNTCKKLYRRLKQDYLIIN